jgi:hypothetical protein
MSQDPTSDPLPDPLPSTDRLRPKNSLRKQYLLAFIALFFICGICSLFSLLFPSSGPRETSTAEIAQQSDAPAESTAGASRDDPTSTVEPQDTYTPEPTNTPLPTYTPLPTHTPLPTPTSPPTTIPPEPTPAPEPTAFQPAPPTLEELRDLTPAEMTLRETLDRALGESNRGFESKLTLFAAYPPLYYDNAIVIGWAADDAASNALIRERMQHDTLTVLRAVHDNGLDYDAILIGSTYPMSIEHLDMVDEVEVLTLTFERDTLNAIDWDTITPSQVFDLADLFIIDPMFEE